MTGNEDLTVQFGEDPPWDDLPPVDRDNEDVHSCATCASYEIGEDTRDDEQYAKCFSGSSNE